MNDIYKRQNENSAILYLNSARKEYSKGKIIAIIMFFSMVVIPIILSVVVAVINNDIFSTISIVLSFIIFIIGEIENFCLKKQKLLGASLQFKFDQIVLGLKYSNKYLEDSLIDSFSINASLAKYKNKIDKSLYNWYADYSEDINDIAVFKCLKENILWDNSLRKKYLVLIISIFTLLCTALVCISILLNQSLLHFISIISFILPLLSYYIRGIKKLSSDIVKQNKIKVTIEKDNELCKLKNTRKLRDNNTQLSIELFNYRKSLYLVPNWFFKITRKKYENIFNEKGIS